MSSASSLVQNGKMATLPQKGREVEGGGGREGGGEGRMRLGGREDRKERESGG